MAPGSSNRQVPLVTPGTDPATSPAADPSVARRIRRSAWLLGLLAMVFYLGFIAATALRG